MLSFAAILPAGALAEDGARVSYDKGTILEFPDQGFEMKLNVQLQGRYSYESYDNSEARGVEDRSDFHLRRARLVATGSAMEDKFSYMLENDFAGGSGRTNDGESDLKDAWLQYNAEDFSLLMGQTRVPLGRQNRVRNMNLQFLERSTTSEYFDKDRNVGLMFHGANDGLGWALGVFNGESTGEGANLRGQDANVMGTFALNYSEGEYDRNQETQVGVDGCGWTVGTSVNVGQGELADVDYDEVVANVDFGMMSGGWTLQGEYFFSSLDSDGASTVEDNGFYVQTGMFVEENTEVALRYGAIFQDKNTTDADINEYSAVVNRYLDGHNLKVQTGVTFIQNDPATGSSQDDFIFDIQLAAYI